MLEGFPYKAIILDLDGVITDTRRLHLSAWKETFDEFLEEPLKPEEYDQYIDGKPREEGVRSMLQHRGLPQPDQEITELAEKKDKRYREMLRRVGPEVFEDSVDAIRKWKDEGLPMAVVSSSRNCQEVLQRAGIEELFDVRVDGKTGEERQLNGKPEADYFLEAAKELGVPAEEIAVVEDSVAGIRAGKRGRFKGVIGMSRPGQTPPAELYSEGADTVVGSLKEVGFRKSALEAWDEIKLRIANKGPAIFLDFDGTLSDLVSDPDKAELRPALKTLLIDLSRSLKTAIVSGRDRADVKRRIGIGDIFYAGCHGFDISGPGGFHYQVEEAFEILPELEKARTSVRNALDGVPGVRFEEKKFFFAIHYRQVHESTQSTLVKEIKKLSSQWPSLHVREGKKVIELGPALEWGKGHAIKKLGEVLEVNQDFHVPIYIGDDLTDEDAFRELNGVGVSIKVQSDPSEETQADYWLLDGAEVEEFIERLVLEYTGEEKLWRHGA